MNHILTIFPISENAVCISGPAIISIEFHKSLLALCVALREKHFAEIDQIAPAYHTITITLRPKISSLQFTEILSTWISENTGFDINEPGPSKSDTFVEIPVRYGGKWGPDLDALAEAKGLSVRDVIDLHTSAVYYVYMIGFTAGFPYLGGLPDQLHFPRRTVPRIRVPAGSVGIGGEQTGVYPHEAPGGWNIIGQTDMILFDVHHDPPARLKPGDYVRFVEVTHD